MPEMIIGKLVAAGLSQALAGAIVNIGGSLLLSVASQALMGGRSQGADLSRELSIPTSLPPYRFAYGKRARIRGSWAPGWVVKDSVLYGCILLNSRPCAGTNARLLIDARSVGLVGNMLDFGQVRSGTVTIVEGATFATVTHSLPGAPVAADCAAWNSTIKGVIGQITATTFGVTIPSAAPAGGVTLNWRALLTSPGAAAVNTPFSGYFNCWLGRGDQGHPPARILAEMGDLTGRDTAKFWTSDKWTGRSVLWVRVVAGPDASRLERWPSAPPAIEVEADWTPVWDPRDDNQDPDDPATWEVSDNQALCLLDALRFNPTARYPLAQLRVSDFTDAADIADQDVALAAGGTEPRYRVGGIVTFIGTGELVNQITPLVDAGAGALMRVGGRLGYAPGAYAAPVLSLSDYLRDGPVKFRATQPTRDIPAAVKAVFPDALAQWESSELTPAPVRDNWDGSEDDVRALPLDLVFSASQAARIQQITARGLALQREFTATFPPSALPAVAGSVAALALPRAGDARNGTYRVTQTAPAEWMGQGDGVALALPMTLRETSAHVYAWDAATDEPDRYVRYVAPPDPAIPTVAFTATLSGGIINLAFPVPISGTTPETSNGFFDYIVNPLAKAIYWEFRQADGPWQPAREIALPASFSGGEGGPYPADRTDSLSPLVSGTTYQFRARCQNADAYGVWLTSAPITTP
ncbi:hypothetical protein [Roseicitreum antarcticum]|nr:hypothetical protein [Roseicitreum antarcticum]